MQLGLKIIPFHVRKITFFSRPYHYIEDNHVCRKFLQMTTNVPYAKCGRYHRK